MVVERWRHRSLTLTLTSPGPPEVNTLISLSMIAVISAVSFISGSLAVLAVAFVQPITSWVNNT